MESKKTHTEVNENMATQDINKTGMIIGRLSLSELLKLIEDAKDSNLRRQIAEWMLILSQHIEKNKKFLDVSEYNLVISLPLLIER